MGEPPADRLEEIRQRHGVAKQIHEDRAWLIAEVERAREAAEEGCDEVRMRLAIYDRTGMEAAQAIKSGDAWPENAWPSPHERIWYTTAQTEIANLRAEVARLRGAGPIPPEPTEEAIEAARVTSEFTAELGMADRLVSRRVTSRMLRAAYAVDFPAYAAHPEEGSEHQ